MVKGIAEFLSEVGALKKASEKVEALKYNDSKQLRIILQGCYDQSVNWLLPDGRPPFTPNVLVDQEHVLIHDIEKLRYFIEGFYPGLKQSKRETMFVQLLENVAPKDAELLVQIKDHIPIKGITAAIVNESFPGMIKSVEVK